MKHRTKFNRLNKSHILMRQLNLVRQIKYFSYFLRYNIFSFLELYLKNKTHENDKIYQNFTQTYIYDIIIRKN